MNTAASAKDRLNRPGAKQPTSAAASSPAGSDARRQQRVQHPASVQRQRGQQVEQHKRQVDPQQRQRRQGGEQPPVGQRRARQQGQRAARRSGRRHAQQLPRRQAVGILQLDRPANGHQAQLWHIDAQCLCRQQVAAFVDGEPDRQRKPIFPATQQRRGDGEHQRKRMDAQLCAPDFHRHLQPQPFRGIDGFAVLAQLKVQPLGAGSQLLPPADLAPGGDRGLVKARVHALKALAVVHQQPVSTA